MTVDRDSIILSSAGKPVALFFAPINRDMYYLSLDIAPKNKDSNSIAKAGNTISMDIDIPSLDIASKKWAGDILSPDIVILSRDIITIS
nr:hypothetical protein [uncultured Draconibacterium sp.]